MEVIISILFAFFLPPFLVGWPLEYGLCYLTKNSPLRTLWRSLPFAAVVVLYFVWQGQMNQPPTGDGPWCPTGAGVVNLLVSFLLFGALAGLGLGWDRHWKLEKKNTEGSNEEKK